MSENPSLLMNPSTLIPMKKPKSHHIGPVSLIATVMNILLATAPFSLPYALKQGGLILGSLLFIFSAFIAVNAVDMIVEAYGITSAMNYNQNEESEFKNVKEDKEIYNSPYFIKNKLEFVALCRSHGNNFFTIFSIVVLSLNLIGSMLLKCVSSCVSLSEALSFLLYGSLTAAAEKWPIDPYYLSVIAFALIATLFGLGNIEGSKGLQLFIMYFRFLLIYLMILGSIYSIFKYGIADLSKIKWFDASHADYMLSNILFTTFMHHSLSGIVYPLRPQSQIKKSFLISYGLQTFSTILHCALALLAFGDRTNECNKFPCEIRDIFNLTYLSLPVVGPLVQFFPALAIAVFPVITITLRNNIMQIIGISSQTVFFIMLLLNNIKEKPSFGKRFLWTMILTIPIYLIAITKISVQQIINITGGFCCLYLLLYLPSLLAYFGRKNYKILREEKNLPPNVHEPRLKSNFWIYMSWAFGPIVFISQIMRFFK